MDWILAHKIEWQWFWVGFAVCAALNAGFAILKLRRS